MTLGAGLFFGLTASPASPPFQPVTMDAWSVSKTPAGQVELTVRELKDRARLEKTLAEAGVPAVVHFNEFCSAADQSDNLTGAAGTHFFGRPVAENGALVAVSINSAALPSGTEVDLGVQDIGSRRGVIENEIVKDGAALTCHPMDVSY